MIFRPRVGTITGQTNGSRVCRLCARNTTLSISWTRSRPAADPRGSKLERSSLTIFTLFIFVTLYIMMMMGRMIMVIMIMMMDDDVKDVVSRMV